MALMNEPGTPNSVIHHVLGQWPHLDYHLFSEDAQLLAIVYGYRKSEWVIYIYRLIDQPFQSNPSLLQIQTLRHKHDQSWLDVQWSTDNRFLFIRTHQHHFKYSFTTRRLQYMKKQYDNNDQKQTVFTKANRKRVIKCGIQHPEEQLIRASLTNRVSHWWFLSHQPSTSDLLCLIPKLDKLDTSYLAIPNQSVPSRALYDELTILLNDSTGIYLNADQQLIFFKWLQSPTRHPLGRVKF